MFRKVLLALRGFPQRVPFRESTRGESVPESAFSTERFTYRGFPSGKELGGRVPESALALRGSLDRVPFRERTRGESVRGGSKCNLLP